MLKNNRIIQLAALAITVLTIFKSDATAQELRAYSPKEKKVLSLVAALPEVQQRVKQIKLQSKGKTQITLLVSAHPDINIPYYQVNVDDNSPRYTNYYQFAVDPKTYQIFYYDATANKQYSLAEWRKQRKIK